MYRVYNKSLNQVWELKQSTIDTISLPILPIVVFHHLGVAKGKYESCKIFVQNKVTYILCIKNVEFYTI
jgi:hypothetical protein